MKRLFRSFFHTQQSGLILIILLLGTLLTIFAGGHKDSVTGQTVNNFLNSYTLVQVATDASFFAIMAIGITMVIISDGIDLSVGSIYALSGVVMAMVLRSTGITAPLPTIAIAIVLSLGIGTLCGFINGTMITRLNVHPFIITLGTMWIFRGIAFVTSKAESILIPESLTNVTKSSLGLNSALYPVPLLIMLVITVIGELYLLKTVMGRNIYAVGGNREASKYCGIRINRTLVGVYTISGLTAGIAALVGNSFYGAASCADANGYELYVIASAVVGGASLSGGKGSALSAALGAVLIILIRQSISTLQWRQDYEWIIIGFAIIIAVVLDRLNTQISNARLARTAGEKVKLAAETAAIQDSTEEK